MDITLRQIDKMTDEELNNTVDACFDRAPETGKLNRLAILLEAQFYRTERQRRADEKAQAERDKVETKRWNTDLINEFIIIGMIGIEIVLSVYGIRLAIAGDSRQSQEMEKELQTFGEMQVVLGKLQESSAATAATLAALQKTTEEMNGRIGKQLSMSFEPSLTANYNTLNGMVELMNMGSTPISIYGFVSGDYDAKFPKPLVILAHTAGHLNDGPFYSEQKEKVHATTANFDFTIFFRAENDDEYILNAQLAMQQFDATPLFAQLINQRVVRNNWGPKYRKGKTWN